MKAKDTLKNILIAGGGAAGFFAAITCAEANPKARVTIIEAGNKLLAKVKISGGGRCNVTHACWEPAELCKYYPRGEKELLGPFTRFCTGDTVDWFEKRNVPLKIEEDGRMFPESDDSQSVMDCLQKAARNAGVKVYTSTRLQSFKALEGGGFEVKVGEKKMYVDKLMLATGSSKNIWQVLEQQGLKVVRPVPSLFTFNIKDERIKGLAGLSVQQVELEVKGLGLRAEGPLLITHWGLSGPAILRLSAWGARKLHDINYDFELAVNFTALRAEEVLEILSEQDSVKKVKNTPLFEIPQRLWKSLFSLEDTWNSLSKKQLKEMADVLCSSKFKVKGKSTFKSEFVTAGGLDLKELDFRRFECKKIPGLFMAGEVLNIDAITGGFNFQAAWTGGHIAGLAMSEA